MKEDRQLIEYEDNEQIKSLLEKGKSSKIISLLKSRPTANLLNLSGYKLLEGEIKTLGKVISQNKTLTDLFLEDSEIDDSGAQILGKALSNNNVMKVISLAHNKISFQGARVLESTISKNNTLESIELVGNISSPSRILLAEKLIKENKNLFSDARLDSYFAEDVRIYVSKMQIREKLDLMSDTPDIKQVNLLSDKQDIMKQFKKKHGTEKLNHLISLANDLSEEGKAFYQDLQESLEGTHSTEEALANLEELMGLTSNNSDLV